MLDVMLIIDVLLIVFIGIPFLMVFIIPLLILYAGKIKGIPSLEYLVKYFNVDISKPPYCDYMERSPALFLFWCGLELYISYLLVVILKPMKWLAIRLYDVSIVAIKALYLHQQDQLKKWNDELDRLEKKKRKGGKD